MAQGRRTDLDVRRAIENEALTRDASAPAIIRKLDADPEFEGRVPTERTVQGIIRGLKPRDQSGPWSLRDVPLDLASEAGLILETVAALAGTALEGDQRPPQITQLEAEWIVRIRRAAPALKPLAAWAEARRYIIRGNSPTGDLDLTVALLALGNDPFMARVAGAALSAKETDS